MKKQFLALALMTLAALPAAAAQHRIGVGIHHWQTVDDLRDEGFEDIDESGSSGVLSYQLVPAGMFKVELDLEYFADGFGGSTEAAYSPQIFLLLGNKLYAGVGAGIIYSDGFEDSSSDPFYAARVGLDFLILPRLHLDINGNYRVNDWNQLDEADTDTITLGAFLRLAL